MKTILSLAIAAAVSLGTGTLCIAQGELPKPSPEHQVLSKMVGEYGGTMKIWPQGPDGPAIEMPFQEENRSILGGFWIESKFTAGPYNARGMSGYDPIKKKYTGTWASNMTPHMSVMEGTYDKETQELTLTFEDYDPLTSKMAKMKSVTKMASGKAETMTMFKMNESNGEWEKSFVLRYAMNKDD